MTVATEVRSVEYAGNSVVEDFPIPFEVFEASHVRVTYYPASGAAVVLTQGASPGYAVDGSLASIKQVYPVSAGVPLETGATIIVERVVPVTQEIDLTNQGVFDAETHEQAFDLGVMVDQQLLDRIKALESAGAPGSVLAGNGLAFAGDLVTLHAVANADASIVVNANDIQVGVLATDNQHGIRGGGTQHAVATGASAGFQSAADKTRQDALWARTITAGAGLTGGGDLSANRTIDVVAGDASIVVGANSLAVGVISAANHGAQTDETLHAVATTTTDGFMSAEDKTKLDGLINVDSLEAFGDTVKTTDATVTTILSWTPTDDSVEHLDVQIVGLSQNATKVGGYHLSATVKRADTTTSLGAVTVLHSHETNTAWDATIDVSSPQVRVRVTGEAALTVAWSVIVRRRRLAFAG